MNHDREWLEREVDRIFPTVISPTEGAFGQWINGLWTWHPSLSFADQKEAFFILLARLLREGRVKLVKPNADVYHRYDLKTDYEYHPSQTIDDPETHWDLPVNEIIKYLMDLWPKSATDTNDRDLNRYFYEIPSIIWLGDDGKWYGS